MTRWREPHPNRVAGDKRLGLSRETIDAVITGAAKLSGQAAAQVDGFVREVSDLVKASPEAAAYEPEPIL